MIAARLAPHAPSAARPIPMRRARSAERRTAASSTAQTPTPVAAYSATWKWPGSARSAPTIPARATRLKLSRSPIDSNSKTSQGSQAAACDMPTCWLWAANQPDRP